MKMHIAAAALVIGASIAIPAIAADCPVVIANVTPSTGPVSGGTLVTITAADGTSFGGCTSVLAPIPEVDWGGVPLYVVGFPNVSQVQVITPYHVPGPVDVTVRTLTGTGTAHQAFTYVDTPSIPTISTTVLVIFGLAIAAIALVRLR